MYFALKLFSWQHLLGPSLQIFAHSNPDRFSDQLSLRALLFNFLWQFWALRGFRSEAPGAPSPRGSGYKLFIHYSVHTVSSAWLRGPESHTTTEDPCDFCWEIHCKQGPENLAAEYMACGLFLSNTLQLQVCSTSTQSQEIILNNTCLLSKTESSICIALNKIVYFTFV